MKTGMETKQQGSFGFCPGLFKALCVLLLGGLILFQGFRSSAAEPQDGDAKNQYAILENSGMLEFFQSDNKYASYQTGTFIDSNGRTYRGMIANIAESFRAAELQSRTGIPVREIRVGIDQTITPVSMNGWFSGLESLEYVDLRSFNTGSVTDMGELFAGCSSVTSVDLYDFDTSKVENMSGMFSGCTSLVNVNFSTSFNTDSVTDMGEMFAGCSSLTAVDLYGFDTSKVENMSGMFSGCTSLVFLDLHQFDTSKVKSMARIFSGCIALEILNLSDRFSTAFVEDMSYMFYNDTSIKELYVDGFDISSATNLSHMFQGCIWANDINLKGLNTSVTDMSYMFAGCTNLQMLDASRFETSFVTDMSYMFASCENLKVIDVSSFKTPNTTKMTRMFQGCSQLRTLDLSGFNTSSVSDMSGMFGSCRNLKSVKLGKEFTVWNENGCLPNSGTWTNGTLGLSNLELCRQYPAHAAEWEGYWYIDSQYAVLSHDPEDEGKMVLIHSMESWLDGELGHIADLSGHVYDGWVYSAQKIGNYSFLNMAETTTETKIKSISAAEGQPITALPVSLYFNDLKYLEHFDPANMDLSKVTSLSFSNCTALKEIDLTDADLSHLRATSGMFYNCTSLTDVNLYGIKDARLTDMISTFQNCSSLKTVDVSMLNTGSVVNMQNLFSGCSSLEEIDLSTFNTSSVVYMNGMFAGCSSLKSLDLSNFDTHELVYMNMYINESGSIGDEPYELAEDINLPMGLGMFEGCSSLKEIDLSSFRTGNVQYMMKLFDGCTSLERIDISSFDTTNVKGMKWMFGYNGKEGNEIHCPNLKSVKLGPKFTVWTDDAQLPPIASWTNSKIKKTASELQSEYPSNASSWAGYWIPDDGSFPFVDVPAGKFFYEPVKWAYFNNPQITTGTDAIHFSPNATCTRGQVVTFLWRANGCPEPKTSKNPFVDVKKSAFYYKAVLWAVEKNITTGTDPTHFSPNDDCTRAQVVTFMYRAAGSPSVSGVKNPFEDVKSKAFYYKAVLWAYKNKITGGTDPTHFTPNDPCTRGQIVTFLYRGR